jgi:tetratricopeptide (TPR) repeat protein
MRICALLVIALFGASGSTGADVVPQRKWLQVRSPNFTVMGEASARDLKLVAERMEQLHAALGQMTGMSSVDTSDVTVIVFKTEASFRPFLPRYQGKPVPAAGYFQPGPMNYVAILSDRDYDYSDVVYHEYVHLVAARALGSMPLWLGEGVAEFFSTFQPVDGGKKARVGDAHATHLERLQREFVPLAALTAVDHDSPAYNERDKQSVFYAESWLLYHYLQIGQKQKYQPRFGRFVDAILDGMPFDRACVEHLGVTMAVLESELRQYAGSLRFYQFEVVLPDALRRLDRLQPTPVSEAEAHAQLAQLLVALREPAEARAHLDHAVAVDPNQPLALARLAEQTVTRAPEEALAFARRSAAAPDQTYLSAYYRARTLSQAANVDSALVEPGVLEAAWRQVATLNPRSADAHEALAQLRADAEDFEPALALQRRAMELEPARDDLHLGMARVLIMKGDTREARSLLGPLAARGSTPAVRQGAREYLGIAARVELARAAGAETPVPERLPAVVDQPAGPPEAVDPPGRPPAAAPAVIPDLHRLREGEAQVFGTMSAIECGSSAAVLVITTANGPVRVRGESLDRIDFVSFRADYSGSINCGPQAQPPPVMVTFRPDREGDTAGEVILVEVVPPGYQPPGR